MTRPRPDIPELAPLATELHALAEQRPGTWDELLAAARLSPHVQADGQVLLYLHRGYTLARQESGQLTPAAWFDAADPQGSLLRAEQTTERVHAGLQDFRERRERLALTAFQAAHPVIRLHPPDDLLFLGAPDPRAHYTDAEIVGTRILERRTSSLALEMGAATLMREATRHRDVPSLEVIQVGWQERYEEPWEAGA